MHDSFLKIGQIQGAKRIGIPFVILVLLELSMSDAVYRFRAFGYTNLAISALRIGSILHLYRSLEKIEPLQ
jgi:hypothetical protein